MLLVHHVDGELAERVVAPRTAAGQHAIIFRPVTVIVPEAWVQQDQALARRREIHHRLATFRRGPLRRVHAQDGHIHFRQFARRHRAVLGVVHGVTRRLERGGVGEVEEFLVVVRTAAAHQQHLRTRTPGERSRRNNRGRCRGLQRTRQRGIAQIRRHRHGRRRHGVVIAFEGNLLHDRAALELEAVEAQLIALRQIVHESGAGHIRHAIVVAKLLAVLGNKFLRRAAGVLDRDLERGNFVRHRWETPARHTAENVQLLRRHADLDLHLLRHLRFRERPVLPAPEHHHVVA